MLKLLGKNSLKLFLKKEKTRKIDTKIQRLNGIILKNKLSASYQNQIINALKPYKLTDYLLENQTIERPYDHRSVQQVVQQALQKVDNIKPITLHWL